MATKKTTSRTPAKKTSSGSTAKKTTKKTAKKSSADASPDSRSGSDAPRSAKRPASSNRSRNQTPASGKKLSGAAVASGAARQLLQLTGRDVEGVTGLEKTEDGWRVQVEVLEVRRIPDTTDVLALYDIDVDSDGELMGYHRVHRYVRGAPGESER